MKIMKILILSEKLSTLHFAKSKSVEKNSISVVPWNNNVFMHSRKDDNVTIYIPLIESEFEKYLENIFNKEKSEDLIHDNTRVLIRTIKEAIEEEKIEKIIFCFEESNISDIFLSSILSKAGVTGKEVSVSYFSGISLEPLDEIDIPSESNWICSEDFISKGGILLAEYQKVETAINGIREEGFPAYSPDMFSLLELVREKERMTNKEKKEYVLSTTTEIGEFTTKIASQRKGVGEDELLFYISSFSGMIGLKIKEIKRTRKTLYPPFLYDEFNLTAEIISSGLSYEEIKSIFESNFGEIVSLTNTGKISAVREFSKTTRISISSLCNVISDYTGMEYTKVRKKIISHPSYKKGMFAVLPLVDTVNAFSNKSILSLLDRQIGNLFKESAVIDFVEISAIPVYPSVDSESEEDNIISSYAEPEEFKLVQKEIVEEGWINDGWDTDFKKDSIVLSEGDFLPVHSSPKPIHHMSHPLYKKMLYSAILKYCITDPRLGFRLIDLAYDIALLEDKKVGGYSCLTKLGEAYLNHYLFINENINFIKSDGENKTFYNKIFSYYQKNKVKIRKVNLG